MSQPSAPAEGRFRGGFGAVGRIRRRGKDVLHAAAGPHDQFLNKVRKAGQAGVVEDVTLINMNDALAGERQACARTI